MKILFPIASIFLLALISWCDMYADVESKWTDSEVAFGADTMQWKNVMRSPENPQFGFGVINDAKFLYMRVVSCKDSVNRQILRSGFTTWFSCSSKSGKWFGVHFPIGKKKNAEKKPSEKENMTDSAEFNAQRDNVPQEMELIGPETEDSIPVKTNVAESMGIVVRLFPSPEKLVYELKIPLRPDSVCKYAIDIGKDSVVNVIFQTDAPVLSNRGRGESQNVGGGGSMGLGRSAHKGGGHEGTSEEAPVQFKEAFSLKLADKPVK